MYCAKDIARYIINYSNEKEYGISNLKLQKILYFIQAYFLTETSKPCFREKIEAWDFGPIVPEVYREYKKYGGCNILKASAGKCYISFLDKNRIEKVVDKFSAYTATELAEISKSQDPWLNAYASYQKREITLESIRRFFASKGGKT